MTSTIELTSRQVKTSEVPPRTKRRMESIFGSDPKELYGDVEVPPGSRNFEYKLLPYTVQELAAVAYEKATRSQKYCWFSKETRYGGTHIGFYIEEGHHTCTHSEDINEEADSVLVSIWHRAAADRGEEL